NLFYEVFDKGVLSDGEGRAVDFKNTVLFLTSNLASDVITELCRADPIPAGTTVTDAIRPILSNHFKPALLARMTIVPYYLLAAGAMQGIVRLKLDKLAQRLAANQRIKLNYTDEVVAQIAARCTEVETGARNIDFILTIGVMPKMSQEILARIGEGQAPAAVSLEMAPDGDFKVAFTQ
ncbi:MAG: AAA family ATPase, partial [Candidatus Binataceae bacterium]